jgi:hypothetical protein
MAGNGIQVGVLCSPVAQMADKVSHLIEGGRDVQRGDSVRRP